MSLTADIDGSSITQYCQEIRWRSKLHGPSTGIVRAPAHLVAAGVGTSELHIYMGGNLVFSGPVWYQEAQGDPNATSVEITAYDHTIYFAKRLCKTSTGNLIQPLLSESTAPEILAAYINNANSYDAGQINGSAMPVTVDSVASGGADIEVNALMQFPMSIQSMRNLLVSTGQLDVIINPGVGGSTVALTNGDGGSDLSGSVSYGYGTASFNSQEATLTTDADVLINALWYLLGPRVSDTRWKGSITPTAPHRGGTWPAGLLSKVYGSRTSYGYMQEIKIFDEEDAQAIRPLYEEGWANEAWIRATPRVFASIRPERGVAPNFSVGDLITVAAGNQLAGGFSGVERVYEFEVSCDFDGVMSVTEIITSADQEGAPSLS